LSGGRPSASVKRFAKGQLDLVEGLLGDSWIRRGSSRSPDGGPHSDMQLNVMNARGSPDLAAVRAVCAALSKPVNFMVGIKGKSFSVGELAKAGVKRISLATSLYRAAMTGLLDAAYEVKDSGRFSFLDRCVTTPELNTLMGI
jgi:hypothetical protein